MNKKKIILIFAIIVFLVALIIFIVLRNIESKPKEPLIKYTNQNKAEGFAFYDENENQIRISDYEETPMLIMLWNSSNNSFDLLNTIQDIYKDYKQSVTFFIINTNESNENIIEKVREYGFTMPIYYDTENVARKYYSYLKLPTVIFLNSDGTKLTQIEAKITEKNLRENLDKIAENY